MSRMSTEVMSSMLEEPIVGVLATLRRDGRPYTVPVWWLHDDGVFYISGTTTRVWCKQLQADPRCSLCIETTAPAARHIGIDGRATPLLRPEVDIWPVTRRLAAKYVGLGDPARAPAVDAFFSNMQTEPRMLFQIEPEVWRGIDLTVYRGKRADREFQERTRSSGS